MSTVGVKPAERSQAGFTLVELMMTVAVIGVLASIAIPKFQIYMAKAKQSEAVFNLNQIYMLETTYYAENDNYCDSPSLGQSIPCVGFTTSTKSRYLYSVTYSNNNGGIDFVALAQAKTADNIRSGCGQLDQWWTCDHHDIFTDVDCSQLQQGQ